MERDGTEVPQMKVSWVDTDSEWKTGLVTGVPQNSTWISVKMWIGSGPEEEKKMDVNTFPVFHRENQERNSTCPLPPTTKQLSYTCTPALCAPSCWNKQRGVFLSKSTLWLVYKSQPHSPTQASPVILTLFSYIIKFSIFPSHHH